MVLLVLQIALGLSALAAVGFTPLQGPVSMWDLSLTTLHQITGALILAFAVCLMLWQYRLLKMPSSPRKVLT
jgi:cytochrome b561